MQVVVPGDRDTYVLTELTERTEYEVFLSAIYKDEAESEAVSLLETTCERSTLNLLYSDQIDSLSYFCNSTQSGLL